MRAASHPNLPPWRVVFDSRAGVYRHAAEAGFGHSLLAAVVGNVFQALGIGMTLYDGHEWLPIHSAPAPVTGFEFEHGRGAERVRYNQRHYAQALRERKTIRGEHAGYSDLFAPIVVRGRPLAVLIVGPFALARPTSADVLGRWRWLTGRQGHPADPEFAWYLRETLAALVLDGGKARGLEELLECSARLLAGEGRADELANRAMVLRAEIEKGRLVERVWEAVRTMIDERSPRILYSAANRRELGILGLSRVVDQMLVGLIVGGAEPTDPVDDAVRRNAFQRGSVDLGRRLGDVLAGRVGDHGVVFLCGASGSAQRKRQKALDLAQRASAVAHRNFRLSLHFGLSSALEPAPLSRSYEAALAAAESAVTQGIAVVTVEPDERRPAHSLRHLREELARVEERPALLAARFDRYLEAVAIHCGYRVEPTLAHLEVGFERMTEGLLRSGALDEKSFAAMSAGLDRAAGAASTMGNLSAAYRRAVADVAEAVQRPMPARQDRSLRNAVDYIHQNYCTPLRRGQVARIAGFAEGHFSNLFRKREGMAFEDYVARLRLERAGQLLAETDLTVTRVAELSGFGSAPYFCRVFRRARGVTPLEYRRAPTGSKR